MKQNTLVIAITIALSTLFSCKKFVEIEAPRTSLVPATVFKSDALVSSAILGIYRQMAESGYASGDARSISTVSAVLADEYIGYGTAFSPLYQNIILPEDAAIGSLWSGPYLQIYSINTILEGLESSSDITPPVKNQLTGEALFLRAFNYFYLANFFGPVQLNLSTDYSANLIAPRIPVNIVYEQILKDLKAAELLLDDNYITTERVRPNKAAVQALLARTYLYLGNWANAEKYVTLILEKPATYKLVPLDAIFLKNSMETIWQLMPAANNNTPAANFLILTTTPTQISLRPDFVLNAFEPHDLRKTAWVKSITSSGIEYFYPYKYKVRQTTTVSEYEMVFRVAEQFLIRAEARAMQDNLMGAIDDLDAIRARAGLSLVKATNPGISKTDLLIAIQKERRVELFGEWADRWLNLKRTGQTASVLLPLKPNWKPTQLILPIPRAEITNNPGISQNEGY